jgi:hypothetical protein
LIITIEITVKKRKKKIINKIKFLEFLEILNKR